MTARGLHRIVRQAARRPHRHRAQVRWQDSVKRLLDLSLAAAALLVLSPVLAVIWLAVRLTSPGPAVFRQERLGRGQRPFTMYKFRTMCTGNSDAIHRDYVGRLLAEGAPPTGGEQGFYKLESDPRVTRLGAWLRRTSLDELPQLVNVVRGDMSLVGPRPVLAWEAELFNESVRVRFQVPQGLTGLWQVSGRSRLSMRQALDLDVEYVRRQSLGLDLAILARTIPAQLRRGAP
jgi:lipopolysaccharide/colanic/teichoic acid biosynthesis glycosyltransferase